MKRILIYCLVVFSLSSCVFYPVIDREEEILGNGDCLVYLPRWKLDVELVDDLEMCDGSGDDLGYCLVTVGVVIPAGTFVLSGSLVVAGNTLRWVEYQGRCDDGYLNQAVITLKAI